MSVYKPLALLCDLSIKADDKFLSSIVIFFVVGIFLVLGDLAPWRPALVSYISLPVLLHIRPTLWNLTATCSVAHST